MAKISIVKVIPLKKGINKENLTYFTLKEIKEGDIVTIQIKSKEYLALVISVNSLEKSKIDIKDLRFNLKKIINKKEKSIFRKEFIDSVFEINNFYTSKINTAFDALVPSLIKEKYEKFSLFYKNEKKEENKKRIILNEKLVFQNNDEERISFYKTLIREQFAEKKSIIMTLPTIEDVIDYYQKLQKGIENFIYIFHSNLKNKEIEENIKNLSKEDHGVLIIMTPIFLAMPIDNIGTIIIEKESKNAYKMFQKPYYDLRIFIEIFAKNIKAKLIYGDNLISFENIKRYNEGELNSINTLNYRLDNKSVIEIDKRNKENNKDKKKFEIFNEYNIENIKEYLSKEKNIFIFSLRKGLANETVCRDCSSYINCEKCNSPFILYLNKKENKRKFLCNRCGNEKNTNIVCPNCKSWNLISIGIGTNTVYEELKEKFPNTTIYKLDKEEVKNAKEAKVLIDKWENEKGNILIGTEMALFYIKNKINLSIIASFDSLFSIPNYKISEKIIHILIDIQNITKEKIIINTNNEEEGSLQSFKNGNILNFVREELEDRKVLNYPPYMRFIKISYIGNKINIEKTKKYLENIFKEENILIYTSFKNNIKDKFTLNALIKKEISDWTMQTIHNKLNLDKNLFEKLNQLDESFKIEIDPDNLI